MTVDYAVFSGKNRYTNSLLRSEKKELLGSLAFYFDLEICFSAPKEICFM